MSFFRDLFKKKTKVQKIDVTRRFDLIGRIGQGSMSKVWRARDSMSGRMVALKVLDKEKTRVFESKYAGLEKPTEGEIAVALKHPHIVETYEYGTTTDAEQFLVMEFVEGVGLGFLVDMQNELMQENRLRFAVEIGQALEYLHKQGYIHRDINPRNVLLDADYSVKLIDFGLVVPNTPPFQKPGNRHGQSDHMAPELIKRLKIDQRIDVFSYAITCYEMWTKRLPWDKAGFDSAVQRLNTPPKDIREFSENIDDQIAETIMEGLAMHPDDRWPKIGKMVVEFREAQRRLHPEQVDA